jgi:hypothetical protein
MSLAIGQRVRLPSTGELGIVVWVWHNADIDGLDTYVAFFGTEWPAQDRVEMPYILRYAASTLEPVDVVG